MWWEGLGPSVSVWLENPVLYRSLSPFKNKILYVTPLCYKIQNKNMSVTLNCEKHYMINHKKKIPHQGAVKIIILLLLNWQCNTLVWAGARIESQTPFQLFHTVIQSVADMRHRCCGEPADDGGCPKTWRRM